jgi:hypothetical protein
MKHRAFLFIAISCVVNLVAAPGSARAAVVFSDANFGAWTETVSNTTWTADILVGGMMAATAEINVTGLTGEFTAAATNIATITPAGHILAQVSLRDPVNDGGNEGVSRATIKFEITNLQPSYIINGISLTSSGAVLAPEELVNIQFDGASATAVDNSGSTNILLGGIGATPVSIAGGGVINFREPVGWDNVNGFTNGAHSTAWSLDAPGSTSLQARYVTETPPAIAAENLAFGDSLTQVPEPSRIVLTMLGLTGMILAGGRRRQIL